MNGAIYKRESFRQDTAQIIPRLTESKTAISEKVFDRLLKIFVVMSTFFYMATPANFQNPIGWNYALQEMFFRYGTVLLYGYSLYFQPRRKLNCKPLAFFLVYCTVISLVGGFENWNKASLLNVFFGIVLYQMVYERVRLDKVKDYVSWLFWLIVANLGLCFFQMFDADPIFRHIHTGIAPVSEKVVGFMRLQASLGILGGIIAPLLFILHPMTVLVTLPLIFWGKSSISVAAFVASIGLVSWFRMKKKVWLVLAASVLIAGTLYIVKFDAPTGQFNERYKIWNETAKMVLSNKPYTGMGLGSFAMWAPQQVQATQKDNLTWIWVHNEYLQVLFELGIVGLVAVFYFLKGRFDDFRKASENKEVQALAASFVAILIISIAQFPFHQAKMVPLIVFIMALFHAKATECEIEGI